MLTVFVVINYVCSSIKLFTIMCNGDELLDCLLSVYLHLQSLQLRKIRQPQPCIKRNSVGPSQIELATIGSLSTRKRNVNAQRLCFYLFWCIWLNWALHVALLLCALRSVGDARCWYVNIKTTNKHKTTRHAVRLQCSAAPLFFHLLTPFDVLFVSFLCSP